MYHIFSVCLMEVFLRQVNFLDFGLLPTQKKYARMVKRDMTGIFQLAVNMYNCKNLILCPLFHTVTIRYVDSELTPKTGDQKFLL